MQPAWRPLPEHIELMPQDQDLSFQPPSRLEAVAQRTDEEEGNRNHQLQSCSDSAAAVTPADGVFGSDNYCIKATLIASAVLSVRAAIVNVGFAAPDVGKSEEPANQRL